MSTRDFRCCIANCQSTSNANRGVKETLFRFSKDSKRSIFVNNQHFKKDDYTQESIDYYFFINFIIVLYIRACFSFRKYSQHKSLDI